MRTSRMLNMGTTLTAIRLTTMLALAAWILIGAAATADGPDPILQKPAAVTMAQLAAQTGPGVSAVEVSDYAPGHYTGELTPSPPHADMNSWIDRLEDCRKVCE